MNFIIFGKIIKKFRKNEQISDGNYPPELKKKTIFCPNFKNQYQAQVIVQVQDGNNSPEFKKAQYSAQISEASPKGTKVVQVIAEDNDVRLTNSQFVYVIADGNENNTFSIGQSSGDIIVETNELDRESIANYNLTVQAVDNGSPPAIGETTVFIQLIDVNDSPPKLDAEKAFIKENSPPNR